MTGRTPALSAHEREVGFRNYMRHITWNGLGVFLLNHTIVSLMAIHFGASNLEIGYINSAFHVTGLASVFIPRLFRGVRINKLFGWGWMIRGFIALLYGFLLVLNGPAARFFIVVVFTAFALSRTVGFSVAHAVQRDFMRSRDASGSLVRINIRLGWSQLFSQALSFALLTITFFEGILGLVTITYIGAAMNTVASYYLLKVPGRGVVEPSPDRNTLQTFLWSMKREEHAIPLLVHWLGIGLVVLFGFQIVYLRRVIGLPNNISILLIVLEAISAIISNSALKPFADNVGDKPLIVISTLGLTITGLIWAFIPGTLPLPVYFLLGFFSFLFVRSLLTLKGSVMVKSIPEKNRVAYTSAANVMLAVVALIVGLIGGALADIGALAPAIVVHEYSLTFLFTALLAAGTMILSSRLPGNRDMSLRETADIMLSARNLRAFLDAYQLDFAADPATRDTLLLSLERSTTHVATTRLRERLKSPRVAEKERVLRTLFRSPRQELLSDILEDAADPYSYTRREALFALGAYDDAGAKRVLCAVAGIPFDPATASEGLDGNAAQPADSSEDSGVFEVPPSKDDTETAAVALKSLARLAYRPALAEIRRLRATRHLPPRADLDLALAEAILEPAGPQLSTLLSEALEPGSPRYATTRLVIAFNRLGLEPSIETYFRSEARAPGRGFEDLIEDACEFRVVQAQRGQLLRWTGLGEFTSIWNWVQEQTSFEHSEAIAASLSSSLRRCNPPDTVMDTAALAGLYLLHRLLEMSE